MTILLVGLFTQHLELSAAETDRTDEAVAQTQFQPNVPADRRELADVVQTAFKIAHDGWSTDEVILNDELNRSFLLECQHLLPGCNPTHCNWALMNLRKAGKLDSRATKRRNDRHDDYLHAAEIAARLLYDKHGLTVDRVLCCPKFRTEFDRAAQAVAPDISAYRLRKAALSLRKARRLRPELVLRVADWGREILSLRASHIIEAPTAVPDRPGVYIFRDTSGYLYIGESSSLRIRVCKHLDHSDRKSLAHYLWKNGLDQITVELHAFDSNSKAKEKAARRAYESELIRSRQPRFNLAP